MQVAEHSVGCTAVSEIGGIRDKAARKPLRQDAKAADIAIDAVHGRSLREKLPGDRRANAPRRTRQHCLSFKERSHSGITPP